MRLDPPYWVAILLALALHAVASIVMPQAVSPFLSLSEIALNFVYLQNILGAEQILIVAWTLCIEIQFYITFILLLSLAAKTARTPSAATLSDRLVRQTAIIFLVATGYLSLLFAGFTGAQAWFIAYWFYFVSGVLCYWSVRGEMDQRVLFGFVVGYVAVMIASTQSTVEGVPSAMLAGLITGSAIYFVGKKERLTTLWDGAVIQYLGRISYSLYLVHWLVVVIVFRIGTKLTGQNPAFALLYVAAAISLSLGAAHLFFLAVEKPSMSWADRFKNRQAPVRTVQTVAVTNGGFATESESAA